jgi:hypothetical protein
VPVDLCGPAKAADIQAIARSAVRCGLLVGRGDTIGRRDIDMSRPVQGVE